MTYASKGLHYEPAREMFQSPLARRLIVAIIVVSSAITLSLTVLQLYGEYRSELGNIQRVSHQIEVNRSFIILASNAVKTFLVAGFAFAFFHWLVTRHLLSIADYLRGLDLRRRAPPLILVRAAGRPPDELDEVAAAIKGLHENARSLVTELEHKTELAQLLERLARAANEAVSPEAAMEVCLRRICEEGKWTLGRVATFSPGLSESRPAWSQWYCAEPARFDTLKHFCSDKHGVMSRHGVFLQVIRRDQCPVWLSDLTAIDMTKQVRLAMAVQIGFKAAFAFPVIVGGEVAAFLEFFATETRAPDPLFIDGTVGLASQFARLIERSRANETQARLAAIVEHSSDAIIGRALDKTVTSWNPAAERILGYTAAEVMGRNPIEIVPPERRQEFTERSNLIIAGQPAPDIESVRITKDGRRVDVAVSSAPTRDESGRLLGTSVILRDISERKRAEVVLLNRTLLLQRLSRQLMRVEEQERRRLGRELHDRIGANLSALQLSLEMICSKLPPTVAHELETRTDDCKVLLRETIRHVRGVLADLRPPALDEFGLLAALNHYVQQTARIGNIQITTQGTEPSPRMVPDVEIALFRIVQEALNNALRHAHATRITVALEPYAAAVRLTVTDDGCGFDVDLKRRGTGSLGLLTMRERTDAIGARYAIETAPGRGTRIAVTVPHPTTLGKAA